MLPASSSTISLHPLTVKQIHSMPKSTVLPRVGGQGNGLSRCSTPVASCLREGNSRCDQCRRSTLHALPSRGNAPPSRLCHSEHCPQQAPYRKATADAIYDIRSPKPSISWAAKSSEQASGINDAKSYFDTSAYLHRSCCHSNAIHIVPIGRAVAWQLCNPAHAYEIPTDPASEMQFMSKVSRHPMKTW